MSTFGPLLHRDELVKIKAALSLVQGRMMSYQDEEREALERAVRAAVVAALVTRSLRGGMPQTVRWYEEQIAETLFSGGWDVEGVSPVDEHGVRKIR